MDTIGLGRPIGDPFSAVARVFTVPVVLIALLGETKFNVSLYKDQARATVWHFRFSYRSILRMRPDGSWSWLRGDERVRRQVEPLIAEARHAVRESLAWRDLVCDRGDVVPAWAMTAACLDDLSDDGNLHPEPADIDPLITSQFRARLHANAGPRDGAWLETEETADDAR